MKNILILVAIAACTVSISSADKAIIIKDAQTNLEQTKPHDQAYQWKGYATQLAACALIHALGRHLNNRTDLGLVVILAQIYAAGEMKKYISDDVFEFNQQDWAYADNNYSNFWGWLTTEYILSYK